MMRSRRLWSGPVLLMIVVLLVSACGGGTPAESPPSPTNPTTTDPSPPNDDTTPTTTDGLRPVTIAFSYIPNVQFSPFYVAQARGYYEEAGLDVTFDYNYETDTLQRVAQETVEFAHGSGISVLLARQQGLPVRHVMMHYQQFPVVFLSQAEQNITDAETMKGKRLGIPGRFGASYYALLALFYANDMSEEDINVLDIGFTQVEALLSEQVDIVTGYGMNEPIVLEGQGIPVNVVSVSEMIPLVSDGIITHERLIEEEPDLVQGFVSATLRGLQDIFDDPDAAFEISLTYLPEVELSARDLQKQVLIASLPYWEREVLGENDPDAWQQTVTFLRSVNLLTRDIPADEGFTNAFIDGHKE